MDNEKPLETVTETVKPPILSGRAKSLANLKPFPKGKSGNPLGAQKKFWRPETWARRILSLRAEKIMKRHLAAESPELLKGYTKLNAHEALMQRMYMCALKGDVAAARFLEEYAFGAPEQRVVVRHDDPERDAWREKVRALLAKPASLDDAGARAEAAMLTAIALPQLPAPVSGNGHHDGNGHNGGNGHKPAGG